MSMLMWKYQNYLRYKEKKFNTKVYKFKKHLERTRLLLYFKAHVVCIGNN